MLKLLDFESAQEINGSSSKFTRLKKFIARIEAVGIIWIKTAQSLRDNCTERFQNTWCQLNVSSKPPDAMTVCARGLSNSLIEDYGFDCFILMEK